MTIGFRRSQGPVGCDPVGDRLRLAYTLLETARIECERIVCHEPTTEGLVDSVHRDLGLAGFYGSEEMAAPVRQQSLAQAHRRADQLDPARRDPFRRLLEQARAAADALGEVLSTSPSDHLHVAYLYASSALESLDAQLTPNGETHRP